MDDAGANPVIVTLLFALRCLVPLGIMLGVSYLLRRWGWLAEPPPPPANGNGNGHSPAPLHRGRR